MSQVVSSLDVSPASYIDHPQLGQMSAMLRALDAGDRIIKGRIELYSFQRRRLLRKQQQEIQRRAPHSLADSPLGPLAEESGQLVMANLTALMSHLFPDYDHTGLVPDDFERCTDKHAVVNAINHNLAAVVDRIRSGFMAEFWRHVQDVVDLRSCDVFALQPPAGILDPEGSLMSFHYFFIDGEKGRILFVGCVTTSRTAGLTTHSGSEAALSGDEVSSKSGKGSSMESSLHDGEYTFDSDQSDAMRD